LQHDENHQGKLKGDKTEEKHHKLNQKEKGGIFSNKYRRYKINIIKLQRALRNQQIGKHY
jgi:hypothetical protein